MRALQVRPEGLVYAEVPEPAIGPGDVLVRVEAAGINYLDVNTFLNAKPADMPLPIGGEAGGRVVTVGADAATSRSARRCVSVARAAPSVSWSPCRPRGSCRCRMALTYAWPRA